jgi:hypothetical protein
MAHGARNQRIRSLNDGLRRSGSGGRLFVTRGVLGAGDTAIRQILEAVKGFDAFTPENDPYGEHDFGSLTVGERRIIWKIDYYDRDLTYASADPAEPQLTERVLTVMLAEEY